MTTIITNSDLSGAPLLMYDPPVAEATVCAFVGDQAAHLRNFGSGANLTMVGVAGSVDAAFRRFGPAAYINTGVPRTPEMTVIAVYRNTGGAGYGLVASSERDHADGGRRGISLSRSNVDTSLSFNMFGTNASGAVSTVGKTIPANAAAAVFVAGRYQQLSPGGRVAVTRETTPREVSTYASNTGPTFQVSADEASFPIRVGTNYRATPGDIDVGFVMIAPRLLLDAEITAVYESVKRRFSALGVNI